ncbi:MAG: RNA polymerase sigma factor [candidate division WOR-3 bacterium]
MDLYDDFELVREFKDGNAKAFDLLVLRYQGKILRLAYQMVRNKEDAWDLSQETFLRAYRSLHKFKEKASFYTWIYRICINVCLSFLKKSKREKNISSMDLINENQLVEEKTMYYGTNAEIELRISQQEIAKAISNALEKLPLQQKIIFIMRHYDQLNNEEIAEKLHISINGVKSNYHHAIKKLQKLLKNWIE